jgi:hypothetical protein
MSKITETEARTVALIRMHFGCTFSKLALCCEALWNYKRCKEITGYGYGAPMGQGMVVAMEDYFGLERCESDGMYMGAQRCVVCGRSQIAISPARDTPKECGHCGAFSSMWKSEGGGHE